MDATELDDDLSKSMISLADQRENKINLIKTEGPSYHVFLNSSMTLSNGEQRPNPLAAVTQAIKLYTATE